MDSCPHCKKLMPGTGEAFIVTGFTTGMAWSWNANTPEVDPVWEEGSVPVVEQTCRCPR